VPNGSQGRESEKWISNGAPHQARSRKRGLEGDTARDHALALGIGQLERHGSARMDSTGEQCDLCAHNLTSRLHLVDLQSNQSLHAGSVATRLVISVLFCPAVATVRSPQYAAAATKRRRKLTMISIHRRRPRGYWIRFWYKVGGKSSAHELHQRTSLKSSRAMIPKEMAAFPRSDDDATDLVEVWR